MHDLELHVLLLLGLVVGVGKLDEDFDDLGPHCGWFDIYPTLDYHIRHESGSLCGWTNGNAPRYF